MFPKWPTHAADEIEAAIDVLRSGRTNQWTGEHVARFEVAFGEAFELKNCLAAHSGTAALDLCLKGLSIGKEDEVLVPARSYVAAAMAVKRIGGRVVLADAEPLSGNVTVESLESVASSRTSAVIVVHIAGWPCDMESIMQWANARDIRIIEDCAQAHGGRCASGPVGSFGDAAAFSFCQDKILSTGGEGGMACFKKKEDAERAWSWRDHGKIPPSNSMLTAEGLGTNLRMTGFQAAIGLAQLPKLSDWSARRLANANALQEALTDIDSIDVPRPSASVRHAWYMLVAHAENMTLRDQIVASLSEDFPVRAGTVLDVSRGAPWFDPGSPQAETPIAAHLAETSLFLPVHPTADEGDMRDLAAAIEQCV